MKILIINTLLLFCYLGLSQEINLHEVNSGGSTLKYDQIVYSSSIGGLAVRPLTNKNNSLTQGFQQAYNIYLDNPVFNAYSDITLKAFPNPSTDFVYLSLENKTEPVVCYIKILDARGNFIDAPVKYYEFFKGQKITLNLHNIPAGAYLIQVISKNKDEVFAQIKIVKI